MRKLLALAICLLPSLAHATCSGVFQPNTYCGNNSGTAKVPFEISGSTAIVGPGSSTVGDLALWNNTTGSILKDQAPGAFTGVNDTNVTVTLSGSPTIALVNAMTATLGWTGTLAAARLNSNVVQAITNDTNVTGSITAQNLTLGWTGTLSSTRGGTGQSNAAATGFATWSAGVLGSVGASATVLPIANGGTNGTTQQAALNNIAPIPVRAGDLIYWNGSNWVQFSGNNSGTQLLQENASGVPSWTTVAGTGTVTSVAAGAGVSTGDSAITSSGTVSLIVPPEGRLTITTGKPVLIANATAQGTLYYDCFKGNIVPYFDGTADLTDTVASCEVSDAMVSAASAGQVVSGQVYDVWWVHGGANRICLAMSSAVGGGGGWASDTGSPSNTARGTGYSQLDLTTRPYITNKNSITNCFNGATNYGAVSANQGTYLGTIYATANGQTGMAFSASASGGGGNILGVFNAYNQVPIIAVNFDTKASWAYASATWRLVDNSASNAISWVDGLQQSAVRGEYMVNSTSGAGISVVGCTNDFSSGAPPSQAVIAPGSNSATLFASCNALPQIGFHAMDPVEASFNTTSVSFFGTGAGGSTTQAERFSIQLNM